MQIQRLLEQLDLQQHGAVLSSGDDVHTAVQGRGAAGGLLDGPHHLGAEGRLLLRGLDRLRILEVPPAEESAAAGEECPFAMVWVCLPSMKYTAFSRPSESSGISGWIITVRPAPRMRAPRALASRESARSSSVSTAPAESDGLMTTQSFP